MANIVPIQPKDTLKQTRVPINEQFKELNQDIIQHKASTQAHDATAIKYAGKVVGAGNTKQAIDNVQEQIDTLVVNGDSSPAAAQAAIDANGHDYQNLKLRLDTEHTQLSEQLAETSKYPELEYEKIDGISIVVNKDYPYDDVKRYGIVADFIEEVNPYTNNYDAFQKLLTIAKNGQSFYFNENGRYFFEGPTGFDTSKQLKFYGKHRPVLFMKTGDGFGFTFRGNYIDFVNFDIRGFDNTKGSGLRIIGQSPTYIANSRVEKVWCTNFSNGFFFGDMFNLTIEQNMARDCSVGFYANNVTTMLFSRNNYALRCSTGHILIGIYYSTIINPACDESLTAYNIKNCSSINLFGAGSERNTNGSILVDNSQINIDGFVGDSTNATGTRGTMLTVTNGSRVNLSNATERTTKATTVTSSIVVDATSALDIKNSKVLLNVFGSTGSQINGNAEANGKQIFYERGRQLLYGTEPPTSGSHRVGDKMINTNVNVQNNPVEKWVCIVAGSPGDWRPTGYITNRGPLANRPTLSGWKHVGVQYVVSETNKVITWDSTKWVYADGTLV